MRIHVIVGLVGALLVSALGPTGLSHAAEPYGGSVSLSADYTQLDTEHPTAKLSISTSKPLGSYRVGIYDDTGKLKYTPIWRIALVGTGSPRTWYFGSGGWYCCLVDLVRFVAVSPFSGVVFVRAYMRMRPFRVAGRARPRSPRCHAVGPTG